MPWGRVCWKTFIRLGVFLKDWSYRPVFFLFIMTHRSLAASYKRSLYEAARLVIDAITATSQNHGFYKIAG